LEGTALFGIFNMLGVSNRVKVVVYVLRLRSRPTAGKRAVNLKELKVASPADRLVK
jgi:hypothetical protein